MEIGCNTKTTDLVAKPNLMEQRQEREGGGNGLKMCREKLLILVWSLLPSYPPAVLFVGSRWSQCSMTRHPGNGQGKRPDDWTRSCTVLRSQLAEPQATHSQAVVPSQTFQQAGQGDMLHREGRESEYERRGRRWKDERKVSMNFEYK